MTLINFFDKLNRITLYLLLFLVPIFFLPFSQDILDFSKQNLALILILLSLIGWLGRNMFEEKLTLRRNKVFYLSLFFIFFSLLISSIFSTLPRISFSGSPLIVRDSFLTFVLFLVLAFLIINSLKKKSEFLPFLFFFLIGGAFAGVLNIFQIYRVFLLPFDFARNVSFNTIGATNSLALFAAVLFPISLILAFSSKGFLKIVLAITSFVFIANLVLVNFKTAWLVLMVGILFLFIFGFAGRQRKIRPSWIILLVLSLVLSVFFYFFPAQLPGFPVLPPEISLTFNSEARILRGAFDEGIKNVVLGTGPGTFVFNYSKYRSPLLNQTMFWGTRFSKGSSSFLDWILTKGFLGGITLFFLYFVLVYFIFKNLNKPEVKNFYEIKLGLSAGILGLICASFLYSFNFMLYFSFWFLAAGLVFFFSPKLKEIDLSSYSKMISVNLILVVVIVVSSVLVFFQGQKYFAETKYLKGVEASQVGDLNGSVAYIQEAAKMNPYLDVYWRDLSQVFLIQANSISQNETLPSEEKRRMVNEAIVDGAEAVNKAISVNPVNVANWNVRGFFYRNLIGIEGAADLSLASYQEASRLEPASPFAFGEKGRVYILMAQDSAQKGQDKLQEENLDLAFDSLMTAIELKPDYAPAHYLLAIVYDQKGELEEAISKLKEVKEVVPQDSGTAFQLGLLYWRKEQLEEAQKELERALSLNPDYSNARYTLGLVYDQKGEKDKAKDQFEVVLQINPGNEEVIKILENIEKGLPALEGVAPSQPLVEETPPEIQ